MPTWARTFVLLAGMIAWLAIVSVSLFLQEIPSSVIVGFPAALWLALASSNRVASRRAQNDTEEPAALDAPEDETEGDTA